MPRSGDTPALLGGPAVRSHGPPPWPAADVEVLEILQAAYHDGSWGQYHGAYAPRLEQALRAYHKLDHVLLCGSGTFAVELALRALQVGPGDEVLLAGYDYPGNFLAVHAVGAFPVLVDVEPGNWNLSLEALALAVQARAKAIIASHLHGGLVPMRELMGFAQERRLALVEDAAQCPGAMVQGKIAGTWGDAGILSFGGSKLLSAGRGGALLTSRADVFQRAKTWQKRGNQVCPLSELQAAVLLPQLRKLDPRNQRRLESVQTLAPLLGAFPGLIPFGNREDAANRPGYYKLGFRYDAAAFGLGRARFVAALRAEGIAFDEGFHALHVGRSPKRYRGGSPLTEAQRAHEGAVVLHHPVLLGTGADLAEIARAVGKVHKHRQALANSPGMG